MTTRNLSALLTPKTIAVIGASSRSGGLGRAVLSNIIGGGFPGEIFAANPKPVRVGGAHWVKSVSALPQDLDLAVVATPAASVPAIVEQLGRRRTKTAIVLASGLSKTAGLQGSMITAARQHGVRLLGPNCLGIVVPHAHLNASFSRTRAQPGHLALISQSGAIVTAMMDTAVEREIGFSAIASVGDMADVDFGDLIDLFAADPHTRALLLYVEGVSHPAKFISAARAAAQTKPVIAIKAGQSPATTQAAFSHTGALAGNFDVYRAAFRRAGIVMVETLTELFDAAEVLCRARPIEGNRVAVITNGGGAGILAVDAFARNGLQLATLSEKTVKEMDTALAGHWSQENPVDIGGDADPGEYLDSINILRRDDGVDAELVINCPTALAKPGKIAEAVAGRFAGHPAPGRPRPLVACWLGHANADAARSAFSQTEFPVFEQPEEAVRGLGYLVAARRARETANHNWGHQSCGAHDRAAAVAIIDEARGAGRTRLNEAEAKALLSAYGIPVAETRFAADAAAVEASCVGLTAPYAVKIVSASVSHKSDVGGVALGLPDPSAAAAAASSMAERIVREHPGIVLTGFTVEPMVSRTHSNELIAGLSEDHVFGPVVMVGAGGKAVELLHDRAIELPPLNDALARGMIGRTRIAAKLAGYRDEPPADVASVVSVLNALSAIAIDLPDVVELDVNPLLVDPSGAIALGARVRISAEPHLSRLAIKPIPQEWSTDVVTRDGTPIHIRPVACDDEPLIEAFFRQVSDEDRRFRFMSSSRSLTTDQLLPMIQIDPLRTMTFLAFDRSKELLGLAMLAGDLSRERSEVAISVREHAKGRGIAWKLLEHVLRYAAAHSIHVVESLESADNIAALKLEREMGFDVTPSSGATEVLASKTLSTRRI